MRMLRIILVVLSVVVCLWACFFLVLFCRLRLLGLFNLEKRRL